ncbi:MAG: TonB-dependent receptor [Bryobacteraceae bacterium]
MKKLRIAAASLLAFASLTGTLLAQTSLGTIVGNVLDESGAAIPGVAIKVINEGTAAERSVVANSGGGYTVPSLPPGIYTVQAELAGFRTEVQKNLKLEVNQTLRADLTMKVGEVSERVEVSGVAVQLQTDSSTVATTVDNKKVVELPLNGRSFTQLTVLVPGAVGTGSATFQSTGTTVSISGLRSENNNYTLDGVNNNETFFKSYGVQPSIDAIQEFKVQTNITAAEFGTGAGANVNVVTKSGTNEFHGSLYEFHRNQHLSSQDYFSEQAGQTIPVFRQNEFGGTIGGPILKNRTFFFFGLEETKFGRGQTILSQVPTPAMISGDLSHDYAGDVAPQIFNPASTRVVNGQTVRDPFPNNQIPQNMLDPTTVEYAKIFFPAPNINVPGANFIDTRSEVLDAKQWIGRVDQHFGNNNILTGRFNLNDSSDLRPGGLPATINTLGNTFTNAMISDTHTFGANTILDVRLGYHRNNLQIRDSAPGGISATTAFINTHHISGVPPEKSGVPLFPELGINGITSPSQTGFPFPDDTYSFTGSVSRITGKHLVKAGWDFREMRNLDDGFFTGIFSFSKDPTTDPQNVANTGQAMAAYLLGLPNVAQRNIGDTTAIMRKHDYSAFVQDDWKITPKLTVNLGLRYDYLGWPVHRDNKLGSFDLATGKFIWDGTNPIDGAPANVRRGIVNPRYNNFAPRLGWAYRLNDKTTVRSGYGLFYNGNYLWEAQGTRGNYPFAISETQTNLNLTATPTPLESTFTPILEVTPGANVPLSAQHIVNRNNKTSYTQQWNFHVQRRLTEDLIAEVGYVGNKGTHLTMFSNANTALPGPGDPNPRRPWPVLGATSIMDNEATSTYEGLQAKVEKRFSQGLTFRVNYAFGKAIDNGGSGFGASSAPQNPNDVRADKALSGLYRKNILTADYVYQLPFGRGRKFGSNMNRATDLVLGGWELTGILSASSGSPFTVNIGRDIANVGARSISQRPDLVGDPYAGAHTAPDMWINKAAFAEPAPYTFGNLGRNTLIGPGFAQFDFGGYKNFTITERIALQFRFEAFNLTNRVNFGNPDSNFDDPVGQFGRITGLAGRPREEQISLKLMF